MQVRVGPVVEDGQVVNSIWTHTDVTERAQEERLLELRNRALNYMSDGIFICDRQGSVLYTNQGFARLTGYEQRDAVGQPWTFLAVGSGPNTHLSAALLRYQDVDSHLRRLHASATQRRVLGSSERMSMHSLSYTVHMLASGPFLRAAGFLAGQGCKQGGAAEDEPGNR